MVSLFNSNKLFSLQGLFNLRGSDVVFTPVFFAYAMIKLDEVM